MKVFEKYAFLSAGILMGMSWLLPNHYRPWTTFHSDAMMGVAFCLLMLLTLVGGSRTPFQVNVFHGVVAGLFVLTLLYPLIGALHYRMQVTMPALYILGFFLASIIGQRLSRTKVDVFEALVFIPPFIVAVVSVGIQIAQWLWIPEYGVTDIWISASDGVRPAANLNQPNQLATLLLWGLISVLWLYKKNVISIYGVGIISAFIAIGVGLTLSRAALVGFFIISIWLFIRHASRVKWGHFIFWLMTTLFLCFSWVMHTRIPELLQLASVANEGVTSLGRGNGVRIDIWKMFLMSVSQNPLIGFGPMMTLSAQFSQMEFFPMLGVVLYSHAHNIVLDLMVWYGVPVTLTFFGVLIYWFFAVVRTSLSEVRGNSDLYISMLLVMLIHANLELPLHHAYFLLPTGLLMGGLMYGFKGYLSKFTYSISTVFVWLVFLISFLGFGVVVGEYFKIEKQVESYRFKAANIVGAEVPVVPELLILDQLSDQLWFNMIDPNSIISSIDLNRAKNFVESYSYCDVVNKYVVLLKSNHQTDLASEQEKRYQKKCLHF